MNSRDVPKLEPTREGEKLLKEWLAAKEREEETSRDANRARCDRANAEIALANWLLPTDAKPGEKVLMWCGHDLIQAERRDNGAVSVSVRQTRKP